MIYGQFYYAGPFLELSLYILLILPIFFFKSNKYSLIYSIVIGVIFSLLVFLNLMMFESTGDIFSFSYLAMIGTTVSVFNSSYIPWKSIIYSLIIYLVTSGLIVTMYFLTKKGSEKIDKKVKHPAIISGIMAAIFLIFNSCTLIFVKDANESGLNPFQTINFITQTQKKESLNKFGVLNFSFSDLVTTINPTSNDKIKTKDANDRLNTSDYQGICQNYNVLTIMIETGCSYLVNETLTPNLYYLEKDSINLVNNVSKNKTNVSEFIGITGLGASQTSVQSGRIKDRYSLPNMLNNNGYTTSFFHDNNNAFYNRGEEIKNLGFTNSYFANDINPDVIEGIYKWNGSYPLDSDFVDLTLDKLVPVQDEPFFTFYTTFSTHGPYSKKCPNYTKFKNLGYYSKLKEAELEGKWVNICSDDSATIQNQIEYIQCAMMDFDVALGKIINRLKETNLYDNTVIVLYGDHESYYKSDNADKMLMSYVCNIEDSDIYLPERYSTINMICNPTLKKAYAENNGLNENEIVSYTDITSPYVIVPTLLDILGIDYITDRYMGVSIFRTQTKYDNLFYSHETQFYMTSDFVTVSQEEDGIKFKADDISDEDQQLFMKKVKEVVILIYNYNIINNNGGFE